MYIYPYLTYSSFIKLTDHFHPDRSFYFLIVSIDYLVNYIKKINFKLSSDRFLLGLNEILTWSRFPSVLDLNFLN